MHLVKCTLLTSERIAAVTKPDVGGTSKLVIQFVVAYILWYFAINIMINAFSLDIDSSEPCRGMFIVSSDLELPSLDTERYDLSLDHYLMI